MRVHWPPSVAARRHTPASVAGLVALLMASSQPAIALAQASDDWLGPDKALHFSFSAAIAAGGYGGAALVTPDRRWRLATGGGLAIAAGAGKEIADAYGFGDPSWKDFTWDLIGTATGLGVAWLIDRLVWSHLGARPAPTLGHSR
jgi:putative lipoprotein